MRRGHPFFLLPVLLFIGAKAIHASPSPLPERVKIGLATAKSTLVLNLPAGTIISTPEGPRWQVETRATLSLTGRADGHVWAGETDLGPAPLRFSAPEPLGWNGRTYRGDFLVLWRPEGLTLVNEVGLEDYLRGVVPAEVDPAWPMEALKAQAVAARTFTLARLGSHRREGFDLCASVHCQVYLGVSAERPSTDAAVRETAGQVVTFEGRLISAYYHAASGGHTEDVEGVWPTASPLAYLRGVPDPAGASPYDEWQVIFDWQSVEAMVAAKYPAIGKLVDLSVTRRTGAGRVLEMEFIGSNGRVKINGNEARNLFGLRSALFFPEVIRMPVPQVGKEDWILLPVSPSPAGVAVAWVKTLAAGKWKVLSFLLINGRGWGHGVGLSQWGAKGLAEQGYGYIDILKYYYRGTEVENWGSPQNMPRDQGGEAG